MKTGADLVKEIESVLRAHLGLREPEYLVLACWVIHTYCFDQFRHTPYLLVNSPVKQSGKTTVIDLSALLVAKPERAESISPAVLYRLADKEKPTLMLDEIDRLMKSGKETAEAINQILNSGFHHQGIARRMGGKNMDEICSYSTFCPKLLAGIGKVADTLQDRSITIRMRRLAPNESVKPIDEEALDAPLAKLRSSIADWVKANKAKLQTKPEPIAGLNHRQQDISRPLLAIAEAIGHECAASLRRNLVEIFAANPEEDQTIKIQLLADIRRVLNEKSIDKIFTKDLIAALKEIEGAPWSDFGKGKNGITSHDIASNLKGFDIEPRKVRIGAETFQGYTREICADAFNRYLPMEEKDGDEA